MPTRNFSDAETRELVRFLVARRHELGLSKAEFSRRTEITRTTLNKFEIHPRPDPYLSTLRRYARGVGVTLRLEVIADESEVDAEPWPDA